MPNWCSNSLTISHPDTAELKKLAVAFNDDKFFGTIKPVPEALKADETTSFGGEDAEAKNKLRQQLQEQYGYSSWYDFCVNEWGTKWEANSYDNCDYQDGDSHLTVNFDTAWSPPLGIYETLVDQGFSVEGMYYEPGMGFAGIWQDGDDDCYNLGDMDSATAADVLPTDLDECFNISGSMADWEAENEDEDSEELRDWVEEGVEKLGLDEDSAKK